MHAGRTHLAKKVCFGLFTVVSFFAVCEVLLWMAGIEPRAERYDPTHRPSQTPLVFERDGDVYRTRAAARYAFSDQSFSSKKARNGLRIFCLGGSSAYGFPWGPEASFCGVLQDVLTEAHPERIVEVINASGMSFGMRRLSTVADELMRYEPDLFIVYSGHNEFADRPRLVPLGKLGRLVDALDAWLAYSRLYSSLHGLIRGEAPTPPSSPTVFRVRRLSGKTSDARDKARVAARFENELARLIATIRGRGIPVLVATVPCNLRDWRPELSSTSADLSDPESAALRARLLEGRAQLESGEHERALETLTRAREIAPDFAETHYWLGKALESRARWREATVAYRAACDLDAFPIRRTSAINESIRRVAADAEVPLLDVDQLFAEQSEHGLVGFELIEDYVHPTLRGHQLIAWEAWRAMELELSPKAEGAPDRGLFERVVARRRAAPQARSAPYFYNQGVVLERQDQTELAAAAYRRALELEPTYDAAMVNLAILLADEGRIDEAQQLADRAIELDVANPSAHFVAAMLSAHRGEWESAAAGYREVLQLDARNVPALVELGAALAMLGRSAEARSCFERALELDPEDAGANFHLGTMLAVSDADTAWLLLERSLQTDPEHADAHNNLGAILLEQGRAADAESHFRQAIAIEPSRADFHYNLGLASKALGRPIDAERAFRRVLELSPDHAGALRNLRRLEGG
jgi:tetratricopeptide (TPR) repeat protein